MNSEYNNKGYFVLRNAFNAAELADIHGILSTFHEGWKHKNKAFYAERAINSAYITGTEFLASEQRETLFNFIGSTTIMNAALSAIPSSPAFLNTQLFFNPVNNKQKNYWHRDPQYHLSVEEQKAVLCGPEVIHIRVPLMNEPGIELVPGSHRRWDTPEEFDVRLEQHGRNNWEAISTGETVPLNAGDLLVFSANMIHRGLYGMDRFALDILFCEPDPSILKFVNVDCLPDRRQLQGIQNPDAFISTLTARRQNT